MSSDEENQKEFNGIEQLSIGERDTETKEEMIEFKNRRDFEVYAHLPSGVLEKHSVLKRCYDGTVPLTNYTLWHCKLRLNLIREEKREMAKEIEMEMIQLINSLKYDFEFEQKTPECISAQIISVCEIWVKIKEWKEKLHKKLAEQREVLNMATYDLNQMVGNTDYTMSPWKDVGIFSTMQFADLCLCDFALLLLRIKLNVYKCL